jgi:hypothetical protein
MAITSSTLMRWRQKKITVAGEIPDYALLFYHNVSDWADDNADTHGGVPTKNGKNEIFYIYPLNFPEKPDIVYSQEPDITPNYPPMNYVVRCIDSSSDWPTKCDIRYSQSTTLTDKHGSLFTNGGRHAPTTMIGRPRPTTPVAAGIPKLPSEAPENPTTGNRVAKYNIEHIGHFHRVDGLRNSLLSSFPTFSLSPDDNVNFMTTLSLCAIFKNPKKSTTPITTFPKNTLIFYYGEDTLEALYFDPAYSHPIPTKDVGNLYVPISFMPGTEIAGIQTGVQNYDVNLDTDAMTINASSNTEGYHTHVNIQSLNLSTNSPPKFASPRTGTLDVIVDNGNVNNPVGHKHNVKYDFATSLKSKILKTYLTKSNLAPIVDGIIIGYTLGKFSGYGGSSTDGVNVLPPNWYFCDGTNDTPDLRGYYPFTNFEDDPSGEILNSNNEIIVTNIEVETIPWAHDHVGFQSSNISGNPGYLDVGSHTTTYDHSSTTHTHGIVSKPDYFDPVLGGPNATRRINVRLGDVIPYTPPTVDIAFIMFKGGAVEVPDPPAPPVVPVIPATDCATRIPQLENTPNEYTATRYTTPFNTTDIGLESRLITVTGALSGATVWGNNPYTYNSDMNVAAVHAGVCAVGETRQIRQYLPQDYSTTPFGPSVGYYGSTRFGVTTATHPNPICGVFLSNR